MARAMNLANPGQPYVTVGKPKKKKRRPTGTQLPGKPVLGGTISKPPRVPGPTPGRPIMPIKGGPSSGRPIRAIPRRPRAFGDYPDTGAPSDVSRKRI